MNSAYIVFSDADYKTLNSIFTKVISEARNRPKIYNQNYNKDPISTNQRFESNRTKHPQYPTVYEALKIEDPNAGRVFVEWGGIDNLLLMPTFEIAREQIQNQVSTMVVVYKDNLTKTSAFYYFEGLACPQIKSLGFVIGNWVNF